MAKKLSPRSKKKTSGKASSAKRVAKKKTSGKKVSARKAAKKKTPLSKARKKYAPGKGKEVPYDLVYVADSDIHGKGMFALTEIDAGVSLGMLEGTTTDKDGTYVLWLSARKGLRVTNDFRFINHSKKANCALTGTEVVTLKKIRPNEELFHDYGW